MKKIICFLILVQTTFLIAQTKTVVTSNGEKVTINVNTVNTANNGLTKTDGNVQLGGTLTNPTTTITASPANLLAIAGLQPASLTGIDNIVVVSSSGVLSTIDRSLLNNSWQLKGNTGTDPAENFLGTTDDHSLLFKVNNQISGMLTSPTNGANTSFGYLSLMNPDLENGGISNSAFGVGSLLANTTGTNNTAMGGTALQNNKTGKNNAAIGSSALGSNVIGNDNTSMGAWALYAVKNGSGNTGVGLSAGHNLLGNFNTLIGYKSGFHIESGSSNIVIGANSTEDINPSTPDANNELNIGNTLFGTSINGVAGGTTGKIGINVNNPQAELDVNGKAKIHNLPLITAPVTDNLVTTDGSGNLRQSTLADAVANANVGWLLKGNGGTNPAMASTGTDFLGTIDDQPLMFKVKGTNSGMISTDTKGKGNTALGFKSLLNWTTTSVGTQGLNNTAIGNNALAAGGGASDNTAIGFYALLRSVSNGNTAIGSQAMATYTTSVANAGWNTAVGFLAMTGQTPSSVSTGAYNNAFGSSALHDNSSGSGNVAIGFNALSINSIGNYNIAIGHGAGSTGAAGAGTGSNNILIGGVGGTPSILVNPSTVSASNEMNIGNTLFGTGVNSGAAGNTIGKIGINTNAPIATLDVRGAVRTGTPDIALAIGTNSFAGGNGTEASGLNSFAFGGSYTNATPTTFPAAKATGLNSVAFGTSIASGSNSFAGGNNSNAYGLNTFAFGNGAIAGVSGSGDAVFGAVAFGSSTASGNYSFAAGPGNKALANYSASVGQNNTINSGATVAFTAGYNNTINSKNSAAFGSSNIVNATYANPQNSVAMGSTNYTDGNGSVAMGANNKSYADYGVTMGNNNQIDNGSSYSVAMGQNNEMKALSGLNSSGSLVAGQYNKIYGGNYSIALGQYNNVNAASATAIGSYTNVPTGFTGSTIMADVSASSYVFATAANQFTGLFNGGYRFLTNRSNTALGMFVDAVGNVTYSGSSTSVSDVRLKKDIQTLTGVLDNIKQIRGVNYYWKDTSKGTDLQVGMIAQELEKVYPELVITNKETGFKAVNNAQFTGVLLEGIKEQQAQIEDLKTEVETMKKQMQEIKDLLKK